MPRFSGETIEKFLPGGEFEDERIEIIDTDKQVKRLLKLLWRKAEERRAVAVDTEFDAYAPEDQNPIQCWSVSAEDDHRVVIPGELIYEFAHWLGSDDAPKVYQNFMADEEVMEAAGIKARGLHADTLVLDFLVDETDREHNLKHAVRKWLKLKMMGGFKEVFSYVPPGKKKPIMYTWPQIWAEYQDALVIYSGDDPERTRRLYRHHRKVLKARDYWSTYLAEDLPFTLTLINMSKRGMQIDMDRMVAIRTTVLMELARARHVFRARSGKEDLNINSNPQLKALFFEQLKMPELLQTKSEKDRQADTATCMNAEVLDRWSEMRRSNKRGAQLAEVLLAYKQLNTLRGTFIEGIINGVELDGRLYSAFNQIGAVTGRISSRKYMEEYEETYQLKNGEERTRIRKKKKGANMQNLPARSNKDPYGIRGGVVAAPGCKLVVVDKAGFEWWLMAHWSEDPVMLRQSKEQYDPHGQTATNFFKLPCKLEDWKTTLPTYEALKAKYKEERNGGKTGNFGFIYGCQAEKAGKLMGGVGADKGQEYLDAFFELYTGILDYHYRMVDMARREGYVVDISGRRLHLPEIDSDNAGMRFHEENRAKNGPIQGSAAKIMQAIMNMVEHGTKYLKMYPPRGDRRKVALVLEAGERAEYLRRKLKVKKRASKNSGLGTSMINQVHDEIIWEAPEEHAKEALEHAVFIMEHDRYSPIMRVHLPAEGKIGNSWKEAK